MNLESLTQLGVGGIFAYIIIKEVLSFMSKNNKSSGNGSSGNGGNGKSNGTYITRQEHDRLFEVFQRKDNCVEIVKRMDERFNTIDRGIEDVKKLIKDGGK